MFDRTSPDNTSGTSWFKPRQEGKYLPFMARGSNEPPDMIELGTHPRVPSGDHPGGHLMKKKNVVQKNISLEKKNLEGNLNFLSICGRLTSITRLRLTQG